MPCMVVQGVLCWGSVFVVSIIITTSHTHSAPSCLLTYTNGMVQLCGDPAGDKDGEKQSVSSWRVAQRVACSVCDAYVCVCVYVRMFECALAYSHVCMQPCLYRIMFAIIIDRF